MYDDELPLTGLGTVALGGIVFEAAWLVAVGFVLVASGLLLTRLASGR
jgi:hypothetical protein